MADARVIPIDGGRPGRRTSAADAVAAGATRASGERARRRRVSPLLDPEVAEPVGEQPEPERPARSAPRTPAAATPKTARSGSRRTSTPRARPPGPDPAEMAGSLEAATAPEAASSVDALPAGEPPGEWEQKVAGALAFLRRRITGEVEVDEFGFDPELTDTVLLRLMQPLYDKYFRVEVRGLEN